MPCLGIHFLQPGVNVITVSLLSGLWGSKTRAKNFNLLWTMIVFGSLCCWNGAWFWETHRPQSFGFFLIHHCSEQEFVFFCLSCPPFTAYNAKVGHETIRLAVCDTMEAILDGKPHCGNQPFSLSLCHSRFLQNSVFVSNGKCDLFLFCSSSI